MLSAKGRLVARGEQLVALQWPRRELLAELPKQEKSQ